MENLSDVHLYKYRNFHLFDRFVDIIVYNRLYGAPFDSLNDPMEGFFKYNIDADANLISNLRNKKGTARICSLSKSYKNDLLWSYYANGHRGCCIELEPTSKTWSGYEVSYSGKMPTISSSINNVNVILTNKSNHWRHEEEVRYIKYLENKKQDKYLSVKIYRVLLGLKMEGTTKRLVKNLVKLVDPSIKIQEMKRDDILFDYD